MNRGQAPTTSRRRSRTLGSARAATCGPMARASAARSPFKEMYEPRRARRSPKCLSSIFRRMSHKLATPRSPVRQPLGPHRRAACGSGGSRTRPIASIPASKARGTGCAARPTVANRLPDARRCGDRADLDGLAQRRRAATAHAQFVRCGVRLQLEPRWRIDRLRGRQQRFYQRHEDRRCGATYAAGRGCDGAAAGGMRLLARRTPYCLRAAGACAMAQRSTRFSSSLRDNQ